MNNSEKISVIIPVYNVKDYLDEALTSVINQTYKNLEIIIVDDGSTDGSSEICDYYSQIDKRIKVFHQKNYGLSVARNVGLDKATGAYIAFLDSDDFIHHQMYEKLIQSLTVNKTDIALCNFVILPQNKKININRLPEKNGRIPLIKGKHNKKEILDQLIEKRINNAVWNKLYKKELWNNIRFPDNHVYEDVHVLLDIWNVTNSIYVLTEPYLVYRINEKSITHTISFTNIKDLCFAHYEYQKRIKELCTEEQFEIICRHNMIIYIKRCLDTEIINNKEKDLIQQLLKKYIDNNLDIINFKKLTIKEKIIVYIYNNINGWAFLLYIVYKRVKNGRIKKEKEVIPNYSNELNS